MMTLRNLCVAAFVAVLAACGGGGDGGGEGAPTPARAASAALGPDGGSLEAVLEGGTTVRLVVPAGAVDAVTTFRIDPVPSTPDRLGVFTLSPAGVPFGKPVEMTVVLSAESAQKADVVLLLESGDGAVAASGPADPASRTLHARLDELPVAPTAAQAAGRARPLSAVPPGARAAAADPEAIAIAALASQSFGVQLADLVRRVTVLTQREGSIANAVGVQFAFQGILDRDEGPSSGAVRVQAQAWRTFICGQRSFAVSALDSFNGLDTQTFGIRMRDAGVWGRQAESMGHTVVDLEPPLAACDDAPATYLQPLNAALERYAPRLSDALDAENTGGFGFDLFLDTRLPELLALDRELGQLGLASGSLLDVAKRQIDTLRITAYDDCRIRHSQQRQHKLLDRLTGDAIFAGVARYDAAAMLDDVQFCGMTLVWELRAADGEFLDSGRAGGLPRPPGTLRNVAVPSTAATTLRLTGPAIGLGALACPTGSANNEQLVVTMGPSLGQATEVARLTPANDNTYLRENHIDLDMARLKELALPSGGNGTGVLSIRREGGVCNGQFANLTAHTTITEMSIAFDGVTGVIISPAKVNLAPGGTATFRAVVLGSEDQRVTWELPDGGGAISEAGVFTAGNQSAAAVRIVARSVADPSHSAEALAGVGKVVRRYLGDPTGFANVVAIVPREPPCPQVVRPPAGAVTWTETVTCDFAGSSARGTTSVSESYVNGELVTATASGDYTVTGRTPTPQTRAGGLYDLNVIVLQPVVVSIKGHVLSPDPPGNGRDARVLLGSLQNSILGFASQGTTVNFDERVTLAPGEYRLKIEAVTFLSSGQSSGTASFSLNVSFTPAP